ncbi:hypothetical protein G1C96_1231 [Bifidobacterium sp. DSM 109958]|uniref:Uncharacterized protein n=2 Tax=Bifidobacterium moraviense TaxID=2675323 RepID=A0A7Y0HYR0_9BIFI|nr:hypothetical protein [Bifidobacterium sp. DSM 109958]
MVVLLVVAGVLLPCAQYVPAAVAAGAAAVAGLSARRECRICHRFAWLADAGRYGRICPVCDRMIAEGRQQDLLERRSSAPVPVAQPREPFA